MSEDWVLLASVLTLEGLVEGLIHFACFENGKHLYKSAKDEIECLQYLKSKKKRLGEIK